MTLQHWLRVLRKRYPIILLAVITCGAAALGVSLLQKPQYTATVELYVTTETGGAITDEVQGDAVAAARVRSYSHLVTSGPIVDGVHRKLGITDLPVDDRPKISAEPVPDTVIIRVSAEDRNPARARDAANAVGQVFPQLIRELERQADGGQGPVRVVVAEPAELPTVPTSPRPKVNVALGLFFGALLGATLALLVDGLDTSVKAPDDLAEPTGNAPVLGTIAFDSSAGRTLLVTREQPHAPSSEAFRQLRTNVQFVDIDHDLKSFVVTSALPNEGKSTVSANLAAVMAQGGQRVVLVEADLRRPTLSAALGLEGAVGLTNVLIGQLTLDDVIQPWQERLRFLPCGPIPPNPSELLGSHTMVELVKQLEAVADVVIFDSPPLLPVTDAAVLARSTNGAIVVVRAGKTSREQVRRACAALRAVNANIIGTAMNFIRGGGGERYGYAYRYESGERPVLAESITPEPEKHAQPKPRKAPAPAPAAATPAEPQGTLTDEAALAVGALEALRSSSPRRWRRVEDSAPPSPAAPVAVGPADDSAPGGTG